MSTSQNPYDPKPSGQNPYDAAYGFTPDHPQTTTILVLGIIGLVACQLTSPFAWVMGNRVIREIDASDGRIGGRSTVNVGRICGIVGTVLLILSIVAVLVLVVIAFTVPEVFESDDPYDPYG